MNFPFIQGKLYYVASTLYQHIVVPNASDREKGMDQLMDIANMMNCRALDHISIYQVV